MTRYRLVRAVDDGDDCLIVAQGQPEDGFATAKEAEAWAVAHQLDWRWYIDPIVEAAP